MRVVFDYGAIDKRCRVLDFGCGRGFDAEILLHRGFNINRFDPYFFPEMPNGKFHLVTCSYVLNVLTNDNDNRQMVIRQAWSKVEDGGMLFISVRDQKSINNYATAGQWTPFTDGFISSERKGTFQKGFTIEEIDTLIDSCQLNNVLATLTSPQPFNIKDCVTALIHKKVDNVTE